MPGPRVDIEGAEIEAACDCLIDPTPGNLQRCSVLLGSAAARLAESPPPSARRAALRKTIHRAGRLLETAAAYQRGWQNVLLALTSAGYTPEGALAPMPQSSRLSLHG